MRDECNNEAERRERWLTGIRACTPVYNSSIIDRVVEINRVNRQVHLLSSWCVV